MVKLKASTSDYWYYTGLLLVQFKGLQIGYAMAAPPDQVCAHCIYAYHSSSNRYFSLTMTRHALDAFAFDFLSGNGDYLDIVNYVSPEDRPDVTKLTIEELLSLVWFSNNYWIKTYRVGIAFSAS